jgi:hypothetical protein
MANGEVANSEFSFSARPREGGDPGWIPACAGMSGGKAIRYALFAIRFLRSGFYFTDPGYNKKGSRTPTDA